MPEDAPVTMHTLPSISVMRPSLPDRSTGEGVAQFWRNTGQS